MDISFIAVIGVLIASSIFFIVRSNRDFDKLKDIERKLEKDALRAKECKQEFKIKKPAMFKETFIIGQFEFYKSDTNLETWGEKSGLSKLLFQNEEVLP